MRARSVAPPKTNERADSAQKGRTSACATVAQSPTTVSHYSPRRAHFAELTATIRDAFWKAPVRTNAMIATKSQELLTAVSAAALTVR